MAILVKVSWLLLVSLKLIHGNQQLFSTPFYRYDYEYSQEAKGWLKYHVVPSTWADARFQCHAEGAVLFSPLTTQLKRAIVSFVKTKLHLVTHNNNLILGIKNNIKNNNIHTGVHATFAKGVYNSIEGIPLLKLAITWAPNEPDNFENSESCLIMMINENGIMADARCDIVLPYVCYKKDVTLTDLFVSKECGTIDLEYIYEPETGSCYKYHTKILPWSEAYRTCEAEGGYLAIINSDTEAQLIKKIILTRPSNHGDFKALFSEDTYIGYHDWGQLQNFMTIHGESLHEAGYQKWLDGQPNNVSNAETNDHGQMCGGIEKDGRLNDLWCNQPFSFICEMTPNSLRPHHED